MIENFTQLSAEEQNIMETFSDLEDKEHLFLIGLEKLSRETGIGIYGCGRCDCPFLENLEDTELHIEAGYTYEDKVLWVSKDDEYDWEKYKDKIIKERP